MEKDRRVVVDSTNHPSHHRCTTPRLKDGVRTTLPRTWLLAELAYA
jgi:hypothetical protein